jgi:hypothetical protein
MPNAMTTPSKSPIRAGVPIFARRCLISLHPMDVEIVSGGGLVPREPHPKIIVTSVRYRGLGRVELIKYDD